MDVYVDELLQGLRELNAKVTSEIIKTLIEEHAADRQRMINLYNRYKAAENGVPIFTRTTPDYDAINNKLNNDFFSEIIDTKVGYFMGKPITYKVDDNAENKDAVDEVLRDFNRRNNIEDLDSETAKFAAICGYGARLLYIDEEGQPRAMNLPPWEVIFVKDRSLDEPQFALRYYTVTVYDGATKYDRLRAEWYDDTNVTFYIQDGNGEFVLDPTEEPKPHMFDGVPVIEFPNNEERQGDADKVLSLIDAYDRTLSDVNSEIEAFRMAYLAFYGFAPQQEDIEKARETGAFGIPPVPGVETKIEFLTKNLNDSIIEHHLDRLEQNILRFAKTVNFGDEQFAGNLSGVAMKYKLFALESKCITAERKFMAALRRQFKILATVWRERDNLNVDYTDITYHFTRNLPVNYLDEAQTSATLKGLVSEETRLSLLSFVSDVQAEMDRMAREALELDGGGMGLDAGAGLPQDTANGGQGADGAGAGANQGVQPGAEGN